jgi:hypothetical protein
MSQSTIREANPDVIISHWYRLIDDLKISSQQFYSRLHQVLCERKVPMLEGGRIEFHEGGPLSPKRQYLRLKRERVVFDICAAPFGTGGFVSWRMGERELRLNFLGLFIFFAALIALANSIQDYRVILFRLRFDLNNTLTIFGIGAGVIIVVLWLMRSAVSLGLANLDALLLHTPIIAGFYERFLRPITYYRVDLALMYERAVHQAILQVLDELTDAQKLPRLPDSDRKPIMRDFYKR